jgi:hypothetical protein
MSRSRTSLTHGLAIEPVRGIGLRATIATMAGPSALGPVAMALTAVGAVAIGALAIGRLAIKKAVLEELHASNVEIDTLKVNRVEIGGVIWQPTTTPQASPPIHS